MRDKHLLDIDAEATEDQRAGIGGGRALRVEVDFLARQIRKRPDFRADEDMQFRGKQIEDIGDVLLNLRHLGFVFLKGVAVDDGDINPLEIQEVIDVFGGTAGYHRKNMHRAAVAYDAGYFCGEVDGRAFEQATGQTYRRGIEPLSNLRLLRGG